jgi:hypothetical protein
LLASAVVERQSQWTADPRFAAVAQELRVDYPKIDFISPGLTPIETGNILGVQQSLSVLIHCAIAPDISSFERLME